MDPVQTSPTPEPDIPRESPRAILFQFVVFPLAVVLIGVGVFLLFGMLASEDHSVDEYLNTIRSGSDHRRWQAAYQLSKSLKRGEAAKNPDLQRRVAEIYVESKNDDPRIRRYLSMVLGTLGDRRSTRVLTDGLGDPDTETRVYALWALAELRDPAAVPKIRPMLEDPDHDVRKTAYYALGKIGTPDAVELLPEGLNDPVPDVRWNAALALARMRDTRGLGVLREMLDRKRLDAMERLREDQKEEAMITAMSAYTELVGQEAAVQLRQIGSSDPSLRVRSAAKSALEKLGKV